MIARSALCSIGMTSQILHLYISETHKFPQRVIWKRNHQKYTTPRPQINQNFKQTNAECDALAHTPSKDKRKLWFMHGILEPIKLQRRRTMCRLCVPFASSQCVLRRDGRSSFLFQSTVNECRRIYLSLLGTRINYYEWMNEWIFLVSKWLEIHSQLFRCRAAPAISHASLPVSSKRRQIATYNQFEW